MKIHFFGASGEVTGSCYLVQAGSRRILLDCGSIQGGKDQERRNAGRFEFDPKKIDAMVLSHAHIDHVGRIPLLAKRGYRGPIYAHPATIDLSKIMLEDALRLMDAEVERENRRRLRQGQKTIAPLYDERDVREALGQMVPVVYGELREIVPDVQVRLRDAGHILGAAIVELFAKEGERSKTLVFSGDIGPKNTPVMHDPTPIDHADLVLMESTYGDRAHRGREATIAEIGRILREARAQNGMVLIPAFAVGRSQELLYWFTKHYDEWELADWKIVLDSPMANKVVELYRRHHDLLDQSAHALWKNRSPFTLPNLRLIADAQDSRALNETPGGYIVIAGSGMCNGGRIVDHLRHHVWRASTHVIFVGYQAQGTLGRELVDGKKIVKIRGERVVVKAQCHTLGGLSAHADQQELLQWYGHIQGHPPVYLVHGENKAREALAAELRREYRCNAVLSQPGMEVVF